MPEQLEFLLPAIVFCPCGDGVWEGPGSAVKVDAAGTMRLWHARCVEEEHAERQRKRARRAERERSALLRAYERLPK